jgi:prepilin-type processing-associated H-X9-DG protein
MMQYEFPPRPFLYPHTDAWKVLAIAYFVTSGVIAIAAVWFWVQRHRGKPCRASSVWMWIGVGIVHVILSNIVWTEPWIASHNDFPSALSQSGAIAIWLLIAAIVIHSTYAIHNRNSPRAIKNGCVLGVCLLGMCFSMYTPLVGRGPFTTESTCRWNSIRMRHLVASWMQEGRELNCEIQKDQTPPRSWRVDALLGGSEEHQDSYDDSQPWNAKTNLQINPELGEQFSCPATPWYQRKDPNGITFTAWTALTGPNTIFPNGKSLAHEKITDGLANTILLTEAVGQRIPWTEPRDVRGTPDNIGINLPGARKHSSPAILSSYHHPEGAHVLMADGSVDFLSKEIDPRVLEAMITPAGGELAGAY